MSNTMTFKLNDSGDLTWVKEDILSEIKKISPITSSYGGVSAKKSFMTKLSENYNKEKTTKILSFAPVPILLASASGAGVFWDTTMTYIFPWILDISKVFCLIKIAQAFYQENRGGRDSGTGMGAFVTYGKWYLLIAITPWIVELLDQVSGKMLLDLQKQ